MRPRRALRRRRPVQVAHPVPARAVEPGAQPGGRAGVQAVAACPRSRAVPSAHPCPVRRRAPIRRAGCRGQGLPARASRPRQRRGSARRRPSALKRFSATATVNSLAVAGQQPGLRRAASAPGRRSRRAAGPSSGSRRRAATGPRGRDDVAGERRAELLAVQHDGARGCGRARAAPPGVTPATSNVPPSSISISGSLSCSSRQAGRSAGCSATGASSRSATASAAAACPACACVQMTAMISRLADRLEDRRGVACQGR